MSDPKRQKDDEEPSVPFVSTGSKSALITETRRKTPPMPWAADEREAKPKPANTNTSAAQRAMTVDATPSARAVRSAVPSRNAPTPHAPRAYVEGRMRFDVTGERYADLDHRVDVVGNLTSVAPSAPKRAAEAPASRRAEAPVPTALPGVKDRPRSDEPYDIEAALAPHLGWLDDEGKFELLTHLARGDHARALVMMSDAHQRFPRIVSITKAQQIIERAAISRLLKRVGAHDKAPRLKSRPQVARDAAQVVDLVDGKATLDEILQRSKLTRLRTLEVLDDLIRRGAVEVAVGAESRSSRAASPPSASSPAPAPPPQTPREPTPSKPAPGIRVPNALGATAARTFARAVTTPFETAKVPRSQTLRFNEDENGRATLNDPIEVAVQVTLSKSEPPPAPAAQRPSSPPAARTMPGIAPDLTPTPLSAQPVMFPEAEPPPKKDARTELSKLPDLLPALDMPAVDSAVATERERDESDVAVAKAGVEQESIEEDNGLPAVLSFGKPMKSPPRDAAPASAAEVASEPKEAPAEAPTPAQHRDAPKLTFDLADDPASAAVRRSSASLPRVAVPTPSVIAEPVTTSAGRPTWVVPLAFLGSAALLMSVAAVYLVLNKQQGASNGLAPSAQAAASTASAVPTMGAVAPTSAPSVKDATMVLNIEVTPRQAQVFLDQVLLTARPLKQTIPRDGEAHQIRIEALGYKTLRTTFTATGDTNLILALEQMPLRPGALPAPSTQASAPAPQPSAPTPAPTAPPGRLDGL